MKMNKIIVVLATMIILLSGCVDNSEKTQPIVKPIDKPIDTQIPKVVDLAKEDLAKTLSISVNDIELAGIEEITWPTSALGYPKPDEQYLQVETPGFKILLMYKDVTYEYHSDTKDTIIPPPTEKKKEQ